ncbi:MAG: phosphoenolpyruvate--protein phosphotransferase [Candidatus Cloacimonadota bacterium]|nr:MAG: phosphoenolpyruvate--protein phosphotransferase [Candidatus Cloacimonadota bacterium]
MEKILGLGISPGLASGKAVLTNTVNFKIDYRHIDEDEKVNELIKLEKSIEKVALDILDLMNNLNLSEEDKLILATHKMIIEDPDLHKNIKKTVEEDSVCLEHAVYKHFEETVSLFEKMENDFYAQRSTDYKDVGNRLLSEILGIEDNILKNISKGDIAVAEEISPSVIPQMVHKGVAAIVSAKGSATSHCAILAKSMDLVAIFGLGNGLKKIKNGDMLCVDGTTGEIIKNPTETFLEDWENKIRNGIIDRNRLLALKDLPAETKDGITVKIRNNIEFPEETEQVIKYNAEGIGLFRTEFVFLEKHKLPNEEEQYLIYKDILEKVKPAPVTFRTMDIGGDKLSRLISMPKEVNPNLGCRGIRLSLEHKNLFKTQLRAILRAGKGYDLKIMFPMIGAMNELDEAKRILAECSAELSAEKKEHNQNYKCGIMIEVPAAALLADKFAEECDFFSIGTNDLIQYTVAIDRNSEQVQKFYDPYNPAVLRLLKFVAEKAREAGIPCSVCGEIASDLKITPFLLKAGISELSVNPNMTLQLKERIRNLDLSEYEDLDETVCDKTYSSEIVEYLKNL